MGASTCVTSCIILEERSAGRGGGGVGRARGERWRWRTFGVRSRGQPTRGVDLSQEARPGASTTSPNRRTVHVVRQRRRLGADVASIAEGRGEGRGETERKCGRAADEHRMGWRAHKFDILGVRSGRRREESSKKELCKGACAGKALALLRLSREGKKCLGQTSFLRSFPARAPPTQRASHGVRRGHRGASLGPSGVGLRCAGAFGPAFSVPLWASPFPFPSSLPLCRRWRPR